MTACRGPQTARERENAHRRVLLLSVALLILLSTTPILGHHFVAGLGFLASNRDHLFGLCVVALQSLLSPVHEGFHVLLFAGLIYAGLDRIRAARELKHVLGSLQGACPQSGSVFERAAKRVVNPSRAFTSSTSCRIPPSLPDGGDHESSSRLNSSVFSRRTSSPP